jgi:prolyl 4-hydroxylase
MIIIENALSKEECNSLINISSNKMTAAKVCGDNIKNYRVANNTWIYEQNDLTKKMKNMISKETGLPIENQESVHIVKYNIGGEYKKHYDFFNENTDYYTKEVARGGNRVFTSLFYLNDNFEGGETEFINLELRIKPETGKLIIWRNLNMDNTNNMDSYHAGLPVTKGEKWISIIWVREKKFI